MTTLGGNLGKYLLAGGIVTQGQLAVALRDQASNKRLPLGVALLGRGYATREQLERAVRCLSRGIDGSFGGKDELVSYTAGRSLRAFRRMAADRPSSPWGGPFTVIKGEA